MKRRMSRPSSSRKYSAIVSAVQADPLARAGGLVHLAEDHDGLVDDARFGHLAEEVVALAAALADAGEDRVATVLGGDVADQLLDDDRLADARPAEDADLAAALERRDEVDDLDAGLEDLRLGLHLVEGGRIAVDGQPRRRTSRHPCRRSG